MKSLLGWMLMVAAVVVVAGCEDAGTEAQVGGKSATPNTSDVTTVGLEADVCGKCGCCAGCDDCCKGETCDECGMQKGTLLCCTGVKPSETALVYCKSCGFEKGTEECCAETNVACEKCSLAEGSPICCKIKSDDKDDEAAPADEKPADKE
jgi:hypothetical protein